MRKLRFSIIDKKNKKRERIPPLGLGGVLFSLFSFLLLFSFATLSKFDEVSAEVANEVGIKVYISILKSNRYNYSIWLICATVCGTVCGTYVFTFLYTYCFTYIITV